MRSVRDEINTGVCARVERLVEDRVEGMVRRQVMYRVWFEVEDRFRSPGQVGSQVWLLVRNDGKGHA